MAGMFSELATIRQEEQTVPPPAPVPPARPAARKRPAQPVPPPVAPVIPQAASPDHALPAPIPPPTPAPAISPVSLPHVSPPAPAPTATFDLTDYPTRSVTFPVTDQERLILDELKLEITRLYQPTTSATKERLLRLAIHHLVDDYHCNGAASFVVQRLNKRRK